MNLGVTALWEIAHTENRGFLYIHIIMSDMNMVRMSEITHHCTEGGK